jgi:acetate kinase
VHVDEIKKKITQLFSSWHRFTIQRTWKFTSLSHFTSAKQMFFVFHQTIPVIAHKYAILINLTETILVYGFHGTSHKYVSEELENT